MTATCELGYKKIAEEQIRLARILQRFLGSLTGKHDPKFKEKYMVRYDGLDKKGEGKIEARIKLAGYLKSFFCRNG